MQEIIITMKYENLKKMNNTKISKVSSKDISYIFDYLNKFKTKKNKEDYIMIAPSWNFCGKLFKSKTCFTLIDNLIKNGSKGNFLKWNILKHK